MDNPTKVITLAATSKNLKTQQSRRIDRAVRKVKTRRLCFVLKVLNVLRAMHIMHIMFSDVLY